MFVNWDEAIEKNILNNKKELLNVCLRYKNH